MATALAPRMENAFSIAAALVESDRPGRSGITTPIGPLNRSTGMRVPRPVQAGGRAPMMRSKSGGRGSSKEVSMTFKVQTE